MELRSDFGIIGGDFEDVKEVIPDADGSVEDEITLLSTGGVVKCLLQVGQQLILPPPGFFALSFCDLALVLEQRLHVSLVKLVNFYLAHEE